MNSKFLPIVLCALIPLSLAAADKAAEDEYDRLDGKGKSRKKVHVIEWEGNLEIHVYPAGSLKGLGLKLDKKNKDKPVMVISYRFDDGEKPLIRRAILGIPMNEGFQTFRDLSADGYDKVMISNNGLALSKSIVAFKLDPEPSQLYPDGHPALLAGDASKDPAKGRTPAAEGRSAPSESRAKNWNLEQQKAIVTTGESAGEGGTLDSESGTIRPFRW